MVSCHPISDAYRVEAQLLRTFVTVARLGSFSAAAAELGYTQAAISQQIAALEGDLKVRLLTRRPVTPTEAGTRLLEHAEPILLRLDAARADVTRMTRPPSAALAVGMTPLIRLAAAGHGLVLLPETALAVTGITAIPVTAPRVVHRLELVHGTFRDGSPAAELAALLTPRH
jgi:molybdenum-dependent DNA-binding transcriptional regulator ModE